MARTLAMPARPRRVRGWRHGLRVASARNWVSATTPRG